jgi:DNA-binding helix-hairpin-helix protein with protein kinase domain
MGLLLDLLCVLVLGIGCQIVNHFAAIWMSRKRRRSLARRENLRRKNTGLKIKMELDELLSQYQQGKLSEQQYLDKANPLIDKLADLN